jgi:hypothetical protein
MMKVLGLAIIYALVSQPIYIAAMMEPAPGTLYLPMIVYLSGFVPNSLTPFCT